MNLSCPIQEFYFSSIPEQAPIMIDFRRLFSDIAFVWYRFLLSLRSLDARLECWGHILNVQKLVGLRVDCDRDCLLLLVDQTGPACHTNRRSCFYTAVEGGAERELSAPMTE